MITAETNPDETVLAHPRPMAVATTTATSYDAEQFAAAERDTAQSLVADTAIAAVLWRSAVCRWPLASGWDSAVLNLSQDFADLVSRSMVSRTLPLHSPEDEPRLAECWAAFVSAYRQPHHRLVEEDELLDWDFAIEAAPARPGGLIEVTLQFEGCDEPFPEDDPWAK